MPEKQHLKMRRGTQQVFKYPSKYANIMLQEPGAFKLVLLHHIKYSLSMNDLPTDGGRSVSVPGTEWRIL